jgi:hypothetical protein
VISNTTSSSMANSLQGISFGCVSVSYEGIDPSCNRRSSRRQTRLGHQLRCEPQNGAVEATPGGSRLLPGCQ